MKYLPITYLKHQVAANTGGGDAVSGTWVARPLNTIEGDTASVSLNTATFVFTLLAGTYDIEGSAPFFDVDSCRIKIRNITNSADAIIGATSFINDADESQVYSPIAGIITITSSMSFELQYRVTLSRVTFGLGLTTSDFGVPEIYAQIKITRIR